MDSHPLSEIVLPGRPASCLETDQRASLTAYDGCSNAPQPRVNIGRFYSGLPERTQVGAGCQEKWRRNRVFHPRHSGEGINLCAETLSGSGASTSDRPGRQHRLRITFRPGQLSAAAPTYCRRQRQRPPGLLRSHGRPVQGAPLDSEGPDGGVDSSSAPRPAESAPR